jgi:hypothetical protein
MTIRLTMSVAVESGKVERHNAGEEGLTKMTVKTTRATSLEQFQALVSQWNEACGLLSSTSAMVAHPAYQSIIEMGEPVVPLLLRDLERESTHWFEALKAITGEDPVSAGDWGNIPAMKSAWLAWERSRNLVYAT